MNRKWYFFLHFPIIGAIPALGFIGAETGILPAFLDTLSAEDADTFLTLGFGGWLLGMFVGIPYIIAMRMGNAFGLGYGMSFLYFLSMYFVPIPGWRVIPWIAGFFIPPDEV
jgi:hypothetical protein